MLSKTTTELLLKETEELSKRRSLTKLARVEYPKKVLQEFIENEEFIKREIGEIDYKNKIESTKESEPLIDKKPFTDIQRLGMKDFDQRAKVAMQKIKNNDKKIYPSDLQILAHLAVRRKVASDVIRELRDDKLSVGDGKSVSESGKKSECEGFLIQLGEFRKSLFPGDVEFKEMVEKAKDELEKTMKESQLQFEDFFKKKSIHNSQSPKVKNIINDVGTNITIPTEEEINLLLNIAPEKDKHNLEVELINLMKQQVTKKVKLMQNIRKHALEKLPGVIHQSSKIKDDLSNYLKNTLKLDEEDFPKAQALIETLENVGGRKNNLPPENWNKIILKNILKNQSEEIQHAEERQHAKDMVMAYIMRSERAVDQFIAQRGNINVRNDELRALGINLDDRDVKNVLAKLENREKIHSEDSVLISKDVTRDESEKFLRRMNDLSNSQGIDRVEDLRNHNEQIREILKQDPKNLETEIAKLRNLSGMVDNLTKEEWGKVLKNVDYNEKDSAKENLIKLVRDFEEALDEKAQPEYRKFPIASDVTLIDDYAAIKIKGKFRSFILARDEDKLTDISELIENLTAKVKELEDKQVNNEQDKVKLLDATNQLQPIINKDQARYSNSSDIRQSSKELESTIDSEDTIDSEERSESNSSENVEESIYSYRSQEDNDRRSNLRQRENYSRGRDYGWIHQPPIVNNIYGAGYGDPLNIELLLAKKTEELKKEIEYAKAEVLRLEASAKEAATKAQKEIEDTNAANQQKINDAILSNQEKTRKLIEDSQKKFENQTTANKKAYDDKMAEIAKKEKEAKEREEKRKEAMEPDWDEKDVSYEELEKIGHLSDGDGLAVISEIRGQKKGKLGEEGYFPGLTTYRNGGSVAVYDGKKGLEQFTREVEQSAAKEWSGKDGRPIASIGRIDNLEKEGDSVFCLATASPSGTTKTFISPEIYQTKINSIADSEYEMALSSAVRINALTRYVAALKAAAEKLQIAQPIVLESFSDDGSVLSNDDDEVGSQLSDEDADLTDNESRLSDPDYSPKEEIENEIARIEKVLDNMNAVYKGRKKITREEKKQYLEDMLHLNPMDSNLIDLLKEKDEKLEKKLEKLEDKVFTSQEISILTKDATRVQKEFARLYSAQETNRSVGDMVEKSAQRNKLSVDLDSQEVEKLSNEFAMRQRGKGARVAFNILVPWNVVKGMKQAFDPGKSAYETLLEQPIQHAPLEGISILRPRGTGNIATVCFEGNAKKDIAYLYVPETDYIISVRRAKHTGKVASYEGGPMVDCVANEIIIPKDTVFKLVDGKHVAVPLASLSKRDRDFYDNFQVKAMSNVDGQRKMTTLFNGEVKQYNDLDKKIAYDIDSDQVIKFEVTSTNRHLLEKKIEGAEKVGESYVIQIGSIPDQFGNTLVNLKGVLASDPNNKGGLLIEGPYIEQEDGTAKLLDKNSLKELYADLGVTNPKHQKTFAEITKEIRQTKVMATIVKDGQEHFVKLPIADGVTPSTVVKEARVAGKMEHNIQNAVRVGPKGGGGRGAG